MFVISMLVRVGLMVSMMLSEMLLRVFVGVISCCGRMCGVIELWVVWVIVVVIVLIVVNR